MRPLFKRDHRLQTINLTDRVSARTHISHENHAALRAGFAGYPANPRWSVNKYCAWKLGCQWRTALNRGEIEIRGQDSLLIPVIES